MNPFKVFSHVQRNYFRSTHFLFLQKKRKKLELICHELAETCFYTLTIISDQCILPFQDLSTRQLGWTTDTPVRLRTCMYIYAPISVKLLQGGLYVYICISICRQPSSWWIKLIDKLATHSQYTTIYVFIKPRGPFFYAFLYTSLSWHSIQITIARLHKLIFYRNENISHYRDYFPTKFKKKI